MARIKKQTIEINSNESLRGVMQEVYNNACNQIGDAQKVINELVAAANPEDIDDVTKIAKAKTDALKVKDSAIKIKLELGKLQSNIIKEGGDVVKAVTGSSEIVSNDSFAKIRDIVKNRESN